MSKPVPTVTVALSALTRQSAQRVAAALWGLPGLMLDGLLVWEERARLRLGLHELSDRTLRDVGISRADVEREAVRPFWLG